MNGFGTRKNKLECLLRILLSVVFVFSLTAVAQTGGNLDLTFNGIGYVSRSVGTSGPVANTATVQPDGKIIAVGTTFISTMGGNGNEGTIARFNSNGTPDTSFGTDGLVFVTPGGNEVFRAVALQPDGKIVAVGQCQIGTIQFLIVRLNPDGTFDSTFDNDGILTTNLIPGSFEEGVDFAIQPDGKIVVLGSSRTNNNQDFVVGRFNPNGSLDTTFSDDGSAVFNISNSTANGFDDKPNSVSLQLDGKIVVGGNGNTANNPIIFRLNPNGTLDTSFGGNGIIFGAAGMGSASVKVQWDEKIVVGGNTIFPFDFFVTRYNSNGTPDVSFDGDGTVTTNLPPSGASDDFAREMILQSDGKIIVAGYTSNTNANFAIVRYNADGSLDSSWGNAGRVMSTFDDYGYGQLFGVTSAMDGKVVAAGRIHNLFGVARYQNSAIAPTAKIIGRIVDSNRRGVSKARVSLTNQQTGATKIILTNPFGYYNFPELPTSTNYTISVSSKSHQFYQNTRNIQLFMDILGLHFVGIQP